MALRLGIARSAEELRHLPKYKWHSVNLDYFRKKDEDSAYWAGLLAADGWVSSNGTVGLCLHANDGATVDAFAKAVSFTGPVISRKRAGTVCGRQVQIYSASKMVSSLEEIYGIVPRKTDTLVPPSGLSVLNSMCFSAGLLDGDGHVVVTRKGVLILGWSGTRDVCEWVKAIWEGVIGHKLPMVFRIKNKCFGWRVSGISANRISRFMLSLPIHRIERKAALMRIATENANADNQPQ